MNPPRYSSFPPVSKSREAVLEVIREAQAEAHPCGPALGIDFEYDPDTRVPHIIGVATRSHAAAWHWSADLGQAVADCGLPLVAYAGVGADKPVLEAGLRTVTPLERWEDPMLRHWCVNPDLSSVPKASIGEDAKDTHVLGMMNLWVACSMLHDVSQWKHCLRGNTQVLLADGSWRRIENLVKFKFTGSVKCFDGTRLVDRQVTGHYRNARANRRFFRLRHKYSCARTSVLTEDHPVLTDRGYVPVSRASGKVCTGLPGFNKEQLGFVSGILLGDGHLEPIGRLRLFNTIPNADYVHLKIKALGNLKGRLYTEQQCINYKPLLHWISGVTAVCKWLVDQDRWNFIISSFDLRSLAIWYLDDGSLSKDSNATIACTSLSFEQAEQLARKIKEAFGIACKLRASKRPGRDSRGPRLWFTTAETKKLCAVLGRYTPDSMRYKLVKDSPEFDPSVYEVSNGTVFWDEIVAEEVPVKNEETVYCLDVAEFHNFVTRGGVVHNCVGVDQCIRERRPCPDHDELAYCAVDAWAGLVTDDSLRAQMTELAIPESYYAFRRRVANVCEAMQRKGVAIDRTVIEALETAIQAKKAVLFPYWMEPLGKNGKPLKNPRRVWTGPFNPNSPKAVCEWFSSNGIDLRDRGGNFSMGKAVVLATLKRKLRPFGLEFDVERGDVVGDFDPERPLPEPLDLLIRLAQKTCAGKGLKSWFDEQYIRNGECHPRFNPVGTCMGRLSSSRPNFQNIPRVGFGAEVRRAVVARPGYKLVKQDYSQGEFSICLWHADGTAALSRAAGAFELLVERSDGAFREAAARQNWTERDVAKSAVHAADYGESLALKKAAELDTSVAIGDRKAGALWVFDGRDLPEWTFRGRYVCFTGRNIAERLFGNYTRESRAKALRIIGTCFEVFPELREFQRAVLRNIELTGEVRLLSGHRLPLYGRIREDDVKQALACMGQGGLAIYAQEGLLRLEDSGITPNLQVHDEVVVEVPVDWSDEQCLEMLRPVVEPSSILPGFTCPAKVKVGPNWKDMREIGTLRYEAPTSLAIK